MGGLSPLEYFVIIFLHGTHLKRKNKMKTVLIFAGLKIAEALGVAIIFTIFSFTTKCIYNFESYWLNGIMGILITAFTISIILSLIVLVIEFIKLNLDWAQKLGGDK